MSLLAECTVQHVCHRTQSLNAICAAASAALIPPIAICVTVAAVTAPIAAVTPPVCSVMGMTFAAVVAISCPVSATVAGSLPPRKAVLAASLPVFVPTARGRVRP